MKFGQLIEYNKNDFFFKNHARNETRKLVSGLFVFFIKALYQIKSSGLQLSFNIFR